MSQIQEKTNGDMTILSKDLCEICINKRHLAQRRRLVNEVISGDTSVINDTDCDAQTYISEMTRLIELAEKIAKHEDLDIFGYLPLTKAGTIPKNKNILLADSKCSATYNGEYFSRKAIQLRLEHGYLPSDAVAISNDPDSVVMLRIDWYDASKKTEPVFDTDGNPHTVVQKKTSYLKPNTLIPGHVYREKTGTEWLYLGILPVKAELFFGNDGDYPDGIVPTESLYLRNMSFGHAHLKWTNKLKAAIGTPKDMTDFLQSYAALVPDWTDKTSFRAKPRQFVEEIAEIFNGTIIRPATIRTPNQPINGGNYQYSFTQYYIG